MAHIYHITTQHEWKEEEAKGFYEAPSLNTEGFIHCSEAAQVAGVLQRYYAGQSNLVRLTIDTDRLTSKLQYDHSPSMNEAFPHVYGPINLDAVIDTEIIK
jgi:uncharacterized protein (DUF952 family)